MNNEDLCSILTWKLQPLLMTKAKIFMKTKNQRLSHTRIIR
jgi:hypothetical protein